jgi:hypothetical protein
VVPAQASRESRAAHLRGVEYLRLGRLGEADAELKAAEAAGGAWPALDLHLGLLAEAAGRPEDAVARYSKYRPHAPAAEHAALDERIARLEIRVRDLQSQREAERLRAEAAERRRQEEARRAQELAAAERARVEAEARARAEREAAAARQRELEIRRRREEEEAYARRPFYRKWWFWTLVTSAAAIGAGTATVLWARSDPSCPRGFRCQ